GLGGSVWQQRRSGELTDRRPGKIEADADLKSRRIREKNLGLSAPTFWEKPDARAKKYLTGLRLRR
ncbi:MAG: hypothetical protein SV686_14650, partial [Thermodesulfobacteriota bacterium]|nr:hypothetical protein [Thermodesulfobacteriota bacterium]